MSSDNIDFSSFLDSIISDPDMMNKVKAISESMGGIGDTEPFYEDKSGDKCDTCDEKWDQTDKRPNNGEKCDLPDKRTTDDIKSKNRAALIRALMPYLSDTRREKADMLLKIISLADLRGLF